ncbi:MAG: hypothetical protein ACJ8DV_07470 [Microvirga sp.]
MAHIPQSTTSADERPLDVTADPETQGNDLERKTAVVAQFRRVRSVTLKTVLQAREKLAPTK